METKFEIDFFLFSFLVEACIPPRPIARAMFWDDVINIEHDRMSLDERRNLHKWINMNPSYKKGLEDKNIDVLLFEARFDPNNQYIITTDFNGEVKNINAFLFNNTYYINKTTFIQADYISSAEKC